MKKLFLLLFLFVSASLYCVDVKKTFEGVTQKAEGFVRGKVEDVTSTLKEKFQIKRKHVFKNNTTHVMMVSILRDGPKLMCRQKKVHRIMPGQKKSIWMPSTVCPLKHIDISFQGKPLFDAQMKNIVTQKLSKVVRGATVRFPGYQGEDEKISGFWRIDVSGGEGKPFIFESARFDYSPFAPRVGIFAREHPGLAGVALGVGGTVAAVGVVFVGITFASWASANTWFTIAAFFASP